MDAKSGQVWTLDRRARFLAELALEDHRRAFRAWAQNCEDDSLQFDRAALAVQLKDRLN